MFIPPAFAVTVALIVSAIVLVCELAARSDESVGRKFEWLRSVASEKLRRLECEIASMGVADGDDLQRIGCAEREI
jgi:hypothetical protein